MNKTVQQLMVDKINANVNEEIVKFIREDLAELHLRREIERMADEINLPFVFTGLKYDDGSWYCGYTVCTGHGSSEEYHGPFTLQQCHEKLREISGEE